MQQDFKATAINQKWCTDITYIHTIKGGWTYLASVINFYSKKIIGWSYRTHITTELALKAKRKHPFGRKGCPYDNACIESFHSLLKKEKVHLHTYVDSKDAYNSIFEYIKSSSNRKRIHNSLNYMTPEAVHNGTHYLALLNMPKISIIIQLETKPQNRLCL